MHISRLIVLAMIAQHRGKVLLSCVLRGTVPCTHDVLGPRQPGCLTLSQLSHQPIQLPWSSSLSQTSDNAHMRGAFVRPQQNLRLLVDSREVPLGALPTNGVQSHSCREIPSHR